MPRRFPLRPLVALTLALSAAGAPLAQSPVPAINLPTLGDSVSEVVPLGEERRYGDWIMSQVRSDPAVLDDPLLQAYVESLWQPLMRASRAQGHISEELGERFAWETLLIRERAINASAWPGGYFMFNLGLIAMTAQRDELASVMAHELSHVTQRHIARGVAGEGKNTAINILGLLLGVLAASATGSVDGGIGVIYAAQAAAQQQQLRFSRDMEREADRVGHAVLAEAGFQPSGMVRMFERLDLANRLMDSGAFPYLRSHPLTSERIGESRQRISLAGTELPPAGLALHSLMAARSRVLMDERAETLGTLVGLEAGARDAGALPQLAARYTAALAAYKLRQRERGDAAALAARRYLNDLPETERAEVDQLLTLLRAEGAALAGDGASAQALLGELPAQAERALLLAHAQAAAAPGAPLRDRLRVLEALQTHLALQPRDAGAWQRSARLWELQGLPLRAMRAQAEVHAARGDLRGAIDRLRAGLRQARGLKGADQIDVAVLDARLRTLLTERRAMFREMYPNAELPPGE
ncbi:M48 family metalloprotease [Pseudorhodoferax sp.]|jgi:predicted Zn-dependent protease|uniref:M48 family metalloprotease n=1 Tax=Pseudorhodoferax sp. TaxID=1993553 RepID=UPI002DD69789|nr:M48 family metalloprotease [Pseudorhodoferax sp.]